MTALTQRRQELRLEWRETPERLEKKIARVGAGTILAYGDKILMAGWYYNGPEEPRWYAAIYETLGDAEPDDPEADLGLLTISPGFFQDEGHAIEWAINTIK